MCNYIVLFPRLKENPSAPTSVKEINQELEEYARKYEAIQRYRRSANSPLTDRTAATTAPDRQRMWSRQDSSESNGRGRGPERPGGGLDRSSCGTTGNGDVDDRADSSRPLGTLNYMNNGELISGTNSITVTQVGAQTFVNNFDKMR
jgi:hypothetical protein